MAKITGQMIEAAHNATHAGIVNSVINAGVPVTRVDMLYRRGIAWGNDGIARSFEKMRELSAMGVQKCTH